jgi:hypothetical protein
MTTRIGANRIANGAITIEKISQTTITALGDASSISNANSNVYITGANGNIGITIAGNTQTTISANLITHNEGVLESIMYRVNAKMLHQILQLAILIITCQLDQLPLQTV